MMRGPRLAKVRHSHDSHRTVDRDMAIQRLRVPPPVTPRVQGEMDNVQFGGEGRIRTYGPLDWTAALRRKSANQKWLPDFGLSRTSPRSSFSISPSSPL